MKAFYPEATIIRPSIMYGTGDYFFERMGWQWSDKLPFPLRPKVINGKQIIQPCHHLDVARAVVCSILDPIRTKGKTYSIYGPVRATKAQIFERVQEVLISERVHFKHYRTWDPRLLALSLSFA